MRRRIRKGLAMLLTAAMVVGLMPGVGTMKVSAEESEASGNEATAEGYDANGFCTSYELTNGTWALKSGATCTHKDCKGYQPAVEGQLDYDINGDKEIDANDKAYKITNAGQLYWFADKVNNDYENYKDKNAVLTNDITVNEGVLSNGELNTEKVSTFRSWTPIGDYLSSDDNRIYMGNFDGQECTISGLYFKDDTKSYVGLFGNSSGNIKRVNVKDSYYYGKSFVGAICGINQGTINDSNNTDSIVKGFKNIIGGVCGHNAGTITDCNNTGEVDGVSNVGGVCGRFYDGSVKNCRNSGNVTGTGTDTNAGVGGVCGYLSRGNCKLETSYNTGDVQGVYYVGGVCGYQSAGSVDSCYNTGNVTGTSTGASVGGVCGLQSANVLTRNCYSTGSVTCNAADTTGTDVGGVCGFQRGAIMNCYHDTGRFTGKAIHFSATESQTVYVEGKTSGLFSNGGVAYLLNSRAAEGSPVWYQNIDNGAAPDTAPVLDSSHGTVYASKPCPVLCSNTESTVSAESRAHSFGEDNICTVCGKKGETIDDPTLKDHKPS